VARWTDVRRIALALPECSERVAHGSATWCVRDKSFAWERPLRPSDIQALGRRAPDGPILAVRVAHLLAKDALLAAKPKSCFTTPHFDGYTSVLVQLEKIAVKDLKDLIVEAWLARAPKRLAREYLASG
jgi:hypothetical protein